jgi:predicted nucleic-acid-binding protein
VIGIDTNVLVRYLVGDDPIQARQAEAFLLRCCSAEEPGFVNRIVLCELAWTLERTYGYARSDIARALEQLLAARELRVEDRAHVLAALAVYRRTAIGFSDAVIAEINRAQGCEATATFDRKASKLGGFVALK